MKVTLVGTGCGSIGTMTASGIYALEHADLIIGAPRLIDSLPGGWGDSRASAVSSEEIMGLIRTFTDENPDIPWNGADMSEETEKRIAVAFSGDTGFYSGAKPLLPMLKNEGIKTDVIPGISSLQLLAARLDMSWQDWKLVSAHGMDCDASREIDSDRYTFFLTGGKLGPSELCMQISEAGFGDLQVAVAERLSYDEERIILGGARDFTGEDFDSLSVLLVWPTGVNMDEEEAETINHGGELELQDINQLFDDPMDQLLQTDDSHIHDMEAVRLHEGEAVPTEERPIETELRPGLPDSMFIRGDVPMTKRDIRAVIAGHMQTERNDVVWDVGAGTGSVSVELALQASGGSVYAVEKDHEGIILIEQNRERFGLGNIHTIEGKAPDVLEDLPAPNKVFIGGSGGNMREIIECALNKNPEVLICVSAILLETATETMVVMDYLGMEIDITQVSISSAKKVSGKHMMIAGNPIFIITGKMTVEQEEAEEENE